MGLMMVQTIIMFVAFCSFFPCSLTVCESSRKQKSGGRQQKSQVDNRKRGGRQQKSSRADKWNYFFNSLASFCIEHPSGLGCMGGLGGLGSLGSLGK